MIYRSALSAVVVALILAGPLSAVDSEGNDEPILASKPYRPLGEAPEALRKSGGSLVQISPDGKTVGVLKFQYSVRVDKAIAKVAWAVVGSFLVLIWVVVCMCAWRRRGRTPGQPHCRRCGYQITGVTSPTCPECGRELTARNRVVPRRAAWIRPAQTLVIFAAVILGLYWQSAKVTEFAEAILPRWDSFALTEWWQNQEAEWFRDLYVEGECYMVEVYDLDSWTLLRSFPLVVGDRWVEFTFGARFERIYGAAVGTGAGDTHIVMWDLATGERELIARWPSEFADVKATSGDETLLYVRHEDGESVLEVKPEGRVVRSRNRRDQSLRVAGYWAVSDAVGARAPEDEGDGIVPKGTKLVSAVTGETVGILPEINPWFIIGVDVPGGRVLVDNRAGVEVYDLRDASQIPGIPNPAVIETGFRGTEPTVRRIGSYWAIVEMQTEGTMDGDGHAAVGLWNIDKQAYSARFDGPEIEPFAMRWEPLKLSANGHRGVMLDTRSGMLWVYDFERYLDR